ncbi:helix-turn-helix transcriptional regulator [bacterium]|nr:helix-turn-helix transcriptional regulator [bacterium]
MTAQNKSIVNLKSSEKVALFLENNNLHKKDFAEMIGVTLSYVYNLIDNAIPFSTRSTTLERIATVMDIEPEEFDEYKIPQEPILIDESIDFLKEKLQEKKLSTVQFLKAFPRKKRLEIVDILRGATPIPLDWKELTLIAQILDIKKEDIYPFWESRLRSLMQAAGVNMQANAGLINTMFDCAREYIES